MTRSRGSREDGLVLDTNNNCYDAGWGDKTDSFHVHILLFMFSSLAEIPNPITGQGDRRRRRRRRDMGWQADLLCRTGTSLVTNLKRSEGIKLNENKNEWRHQSGTKIGLFNAVLTVLINEMNDKVESKCCWLRKALIFCPPPHNYRFLLLLLAPSSCNNSQGTNPTGHF